MQLLLKDCSRNSSYHTYSSQIPLLMIRLRVNAWDGRSPTIDHESIAPLESWVTDLSFKSFKSMWSFHQHFSLTAGILQSTNYDFHEDFLWNFNQCIINPRILPKLQKGLLTYNVYHGFRTINPRGGCPQTIMAPGKLSPRKIASRHNSPCNKFPELLSPGWLPMKKVAPEEICPNPIQLPVKNINFEENLRQLLSWMIPPS